MKDHSNCPFQFINCLLNVSSTHHNQNLLMKSILFPLNQHMQNVPSEKLVLAFTFNGWNSIVTIVSCLFFNFLGLFVFVFTPMSTVFLFSEKKNTSVSWWKLRYTLFGLLQYLKPNRVFSSKSNATKLVFCVAKFGFGLAYRYFFHIAAGWLTKLASCGFSQHITHYRKPPPFSV